MGAAGDGGDVTPAAPPCAAVVGVGVGAAAGVAAKVGGREDDEESFLGPGTLDGDESSLDALDDDESSLLGWDGLSGWPSVPGAVNMPEELNVMVLLLVTLCSLDPKLNKPCVCVWVVCVVAGRTQHSKIVRVPRVVNMWMWSM